MLPGRRLAHPLETVPRQIEADRRRGEGMAQGGVVRNARVDPPTEGGALKSQAIPPLLQLMGGDFVASVERGKNIVVQREVESHANMVGAGAGRSRSARVSELVPVIAQRQASI